MSYGFVSSFRIPRRNLGPPFELFLFDSFLLAGEHEEDVKFVSPETGVVFKFTACLREPFPVQGNADTRFQCQFHRITTNVCGAIDPIVLEKYAIEIT
jgi:hypothetical protein